MIGTCLASRYEVVRELGRGGMGVVYLARDPILEREVAVKLIPPGVLDPDSDERFRREARVLARLDHPGIVGIHDFGAHDDALFYVMPFVPGRNLRAVQESGELTLGDILEIGRQIAIALDYSHTAGIVHRDIKPENVMVHRDADGSLRARVTDFGLAVVQRERRLTGSGIVVGTLAYLAPEQLLCQDLDHATDIYALGTLLYELLTGTTPFNGDVAALTFLVVNATAKRPSEIGVSIPSDVEALVMQCLERDRRRRPSSAGAIAEVLDACIARLRGSDAFAAPHRTGAVHVPARIGPPLIGRQKEFAILQDCLTASATEANYLLIGGPAGIGKTRLFEELERLALTRRVLVLRSAVAGLEQSLPYASLCRIIEEHQRLHGAADLSDLAPELVQRFPMLIEVPELRVHARAAPPTPVGDRMAVFDVLARAFIRIASAQPVVIVIEDTHMGDISVEALEHIGKRMLSMPVLLVATYRSDEIDRAHPMTSLVEAVRKSRHGTVLELGPLTLDAHRQLVASIVGTDRVDDEVAVRTFEATEGNPHFATELLRTLMESHELVKSGTGTWRLASDAAISAESLPATIQQAVARRLERLSDRHRAILSAASVAGRTFDGEQLARAVDEPLSRLDAELDDLLANGYLKEERHGRGDRFVFASRVVRDVLYGAVPRRRRRAMHRALAEHLEQKHASHPERVYGLLVHHFSNADVPEKVIEYGLAATRASLASFSAIDAINAARVVLEFVEEDALPRAEARALLAEALHMAGRTDDALQEVDSAVRLFERIGEPPRAFASAAAAAEMAWQRQKINETRRWVEKALTLGRPSGDPEQLEPLLSLGAAAANLRGDVDAARRYLDEAERLRPRDATADDAQRHGTLHVAFSYALDVIDPARAEITWQAEVATLVFDPLTAVDESARVIPRLAESFAVSNEARTFRFRLRDGVQFHDGRPVTAADVRHSLQRFLRVASPLHRLHIDLIQEVRILSPLEFEIELAQPTPALPAILAYPALAIVPDGTEEVGTNWREGLVGTGPFRVVRFTPRRVLELEANPHYWCPGLPQVERLVISLDQPSAEIAAGFREGRYSLAFDLAPEEHEALRRDRELG
ncbi:MAG TPA: ABC transporter substrate-binding protein, partial [Thermoanaerobaculia bacterium]|nr:ABC transporter substrate-binding protein [Thermoanaerobaculia bacterium]